MEYVIFIGICCHIYWNMLSHLLEYIIIFIGICHHIYLLLNSNSDKKLSKTLQAQHLYEEYLQITAKTLINKRKTGLETASLVSSQQMLCSRV